MLSVLRTSAASVVALAVWTTPLAQGSDFRGFTSASAATQKDWETKFRAIPDAARLRAAMERLSARPHHVGSPYGKSNAEWLRDQSAPFGGEEKLEEYRGLFPPRKSDRSDRSGPTGLSARREGRAI